MLMFCMSGIVLNHRHAVQSVNVSRSLLPHRYHYQGWNGGLLRGTIRYADNNTGRTGVLVYGNSGIWRADGAGAVSGAESCAESGVGFTDFNTGLPEGADFRQIRSVVQTADSNLFAASILGLYRYVDDRTGWRAVQLPVDADEHITDMVCRNDSLIVAGRSSLYVATPPYISFGKIRLKQPADYRQEVTLFRTVWMLHSGELFGTAGRLLMDAVAVILIVLSITGLMFWLLPKYTKRMLRRGHKARRAISMTRLSLVWHDKLGRTTIFLTLFIAITGWCLRPPVMIPLVLTKVPALPGTSLDSDNAWHDKLRMIRYDEETGDWLCSTSEGFYSLKKLDGIPVRLTTAPPVSVMGLNVMQKDDRGRWLCGSFSGMFAWDRRHNAVTDYFTGEPVKEVSGPPFGRRAISGYSADLTARPFAVQYDEGTDAIAQPDALATLPMSLWNVALEVHTGRLYIGNIATYLFIFLTGLLAVWCLLTGRLCRRKS